MRQYGGQVRFDVFWHCSGNGEAVVLILVFWHCSGNGEAVVMIQVFRQCSGNGEW